VEHDREQPEPGSRHWIEQPAERLGAAPTGPGLGQLAPAGNTALTRLLRPSVQRSALTTQGAGALDPEIGAAIDAERGGGAALPDSLRSEMEHHFGVGLDAVRVHTGGRADELNQSVQADAFTSGTDIFFGGGRDPASAAGRELIAHELTHVVQQATGTAGAEGTVSHPHDPAEAQAAEVARTVAQGG
jgi:hypothetical protein